MKKITQGIKKAYARQNRVMNAKFKEVDELTLDEAKEIIKWDNEERRNNAIVKVAIAFGIQYAARKALKKIQEEEMNELAKYKKEHAG